MSMNKQDSIFKFFAEIGIVNQLASAEFRRALAPALNDSEFMVLHHCVNRGDGDSPSHLARVFQITKPSMTAILSKLSAKGLITLAHDTDDGRRKIVRLTPAGRDARDAGIAATAPLFEDLATLFPLEEMEMVEPVLARLRAVMDERRNRRDGLFNDASK